MTFLLLVVGFLFLIKGADIFVAASITIAKKLKIPSIIIGLTIVALGTSAPEIVVSITSSLQGANQMAVGNAIGSNIFNLLFVIGICSLIKPFEVKFSEISKDFWISVGAATFLLVMQLIFVDFIPQTGGLFLLLAFIIYMALLIKASLRKNTTEKKAENTLPLETNQKSMGQSIVLLIIGALAIVIGGQLTVNHAVSIATLLGFSERVIGLTVLAIGTSLPELVTTLTAFRKGEKDVGLGNIIGSNIFNLLLILGISGSLSPLAIDTNLIVDLLVFIASSFLIMFFAYTGKKIIRFEGLVIFSLYITYMVFTVIGA